MLVRILVFICTFQHNSYLKQKAKKAESFHALREGKIGKVYDYLKRSCEVLHFALLNF